MLVTSAGPAIQVDPPGAEVADELVQVVRRRGAAVFALGVARVAEAATGGPRRLSAAILDFLSGPVHLAGQDISGATVFLLAATRPEDVRSFTAIEILAGGERDPRGSRHIGALADPEIPELLFAGGVAPGIGGGPSAAMTVSRARPPAAM